MISLIGKFLFAFHFSITNGNRDCIKKNREIRKRTELKQQKEER